MQKFPNKNLSDLYKLFGESCANEFHGSSKIKLYYILDANNRVRWAFPSNLKTPSFLNTFNSSSIKAYLYIAVCKILFKIKLKFMLSSGSIVVYYDPSKCFLKDLLNDHLINEHFSIFFGTYGDDRKLIIEFNDGISNESIGFIKIPLSERSKKLITNESKNLEILSCKKPLKSLLDFPELRPSRSYEALLIPNIFKDHSIIPKYSMLTPIIDLHNISYEVVTFSNFFEKKVLNNLDTLRVNKIFFNDVSEIKSNQIKDLCTNIVKSLKGLNNLYGKDELVRTSFAHKDFTPWNCRITSNKLSVIDWERADKETSHFFDVCHYIFQNEILVKQNFDTDDIKSKIMFSLKNFNALLGLKLNNKDLEFYFYCFLIDHISTRVELVSKSTEWFPQIDWQLNVWNNMLLNIATQKNTYKL